MTSSKKRNIQIARYRNSDKGKAAIKRGEQNRYKKIQNIIHELKLNGCSICGYNKSERSLHFHHIIKESNKNQLTNMFIHRATNEQIINELNKCMLVCCNCHGEIHD